MLNNAGGGDILARGGMRATWGVNNVSQERWDQAFGSDGGPKSNVAEDEKVVPAPKRRKKK